VTVIDFNWQNRPHQYEPDTLLIGKVSGCSLNHVNVCDVPVIICYSDTSAALCPLLQDALKLTRELGQSTKALEVSNSLALRIASKPVIW